MEAEDKMAEVAERKALVEFYQKNAHGNIQL
jgi:hypothetical protein